MVRVRKDSELGTKQIDEKTRIIYQHSLPTFSSSFPPRAARRAFGFVVPTNAHLQRCWFEFQHLQATNFQLNPGTADSPGLVRRFDKIGVRKPPLGAKPMVQLQRERHNRVCEAWLGTGDNAVGDCDMRLVNCGAGSQHRPVVPSGLGTAVS